MVDIKYTGNCVKIACFFEGNSSTAHYCTALLDWSKTVYMVAIYVVEHKYKRRWDLIKN